MAAFASRLLRWFDTHGRHDLPWQHPRTPYRVWLSEVMLQQTQVATVIPYFERFVARFPDVAALAAAAQDEVLALWSGLGYYSRGRNLHRAAQLCVERHDAALPRTLDALVGLPGIGRSTAGAILAQAHGERVAILDGNVRRVLARHAGIAGHAAQPAVERTLWLQAEAHLPQTRLADYTQALMDLGATVCKPRRPQCARCPLRADCVALASDRVEQLPTAKPKREVPERNVTMLIARDHHGRVLFERRPPSGIWGGLLGLPEFACADTLRAGLGRFGRPRGEPRAGTRHRHAFTHFRLAITTLVVDIDAATAVAEGRHEWHAPDRFGELALPTAVRRVLDLSLRGR